MGQGRRRGSMISNKKYLRNGRRVSVVAVVWHRFLHNLSRSYLLFAFAALILLACDGCQSSFHSPVGEQQTGTPVSLSPGDVIKLSFPATPDLNQTQKIRADGKVNLPLIGEVTAAGKTLLEFQNELVRLYKPQLRNSEVVVTLESGIMQVVVSGAVVKPAKLQFDRPTTVFQAIMEAGGVNEFGNLNKVRLIRTVNGEQQSQVLNLTPTLKGENTQAFYIKDGDVIFVPQSLF
jgi:polysaccharide biosynthesis/export protein